MTALRILRTEPVEQIAAHPDTVRVLHQLLLRSRSAPSAAPVTAATIGQLWPASPLVGDSRLPRDEVRCRPRQP